MFHFASFYISVSQLREARIDGPTNGHTIIKRCEDAFKNGIFERRLKFKDATPRSPMALRRQKEEANQRQYANEILKSVGGCRATGLLEISLLDWQRPISGVSARLFRNPCLILTFYLLGIYINIPATFPLHLSVWLPVCCLPGCL